MDHCYDTPCQNNGSCHNLLDDYSCDCLAEFTGENCQGSFSFFCVCVHFRSCSVIFWVRVVLKGTVVGKIH